MNPRDHVFVCRTDSTRLKFAYTLKVNNNLMNLSCFLPSFLSLPLIPTHPNSKPISPFFQPPIPSQSHPSSTNQQQKMGCAPSREICHDTNPLHPRLRPRYPATTARYDWDKEEGGYTAYRSQRPQRQKCRKADREPREEKVRFEDERSRRRYGDVDAKKREFRRQYDERNGRL